MKDNECFGTVSDLVDKPANSYTKEQIVGWLSIDDSRQDILLEAARLVKEKNIGNICYFRGLIELSNICCKDCLYCGIRRSNPTVVRYTLTNAQVMEAAYYANDKGFGSIAIQSGEDRSVSFVQRIEALVREIRQTTALSITLSLGEQSKETYKRWFDAGAERYLLRIETSEQNLYEALHPNDGKHQFDDRLKALVHLKEVGYQVGTGVMIGLPGQSIESLADDLLFMQQLDIDMCGMGPFLEHPQAPLKLGWLLSPEERLRLSLRMIALLRLLMPDINIAATTALQAIDDQAREKALRYGANVIMPNITPVMVRKNYKLYNNKPISEEAISRQYESLQQRIEAKGCCVEPGNRGTSLHYLKRT